MFIGSTNDREYLRDPTGGRRFWPIPVSVGSIDTGRLRQEVLQIWAEARVLYLGMRENTPAGEDLPLYLSLEADEEAKGYQESRRQETAEEQLAGQIEAWLNEPISDSGDLADASAARRREQVCAMEIHVDMLGRDRASYDQKSAAMIGKALRLVPGWESAGLAETAKFGRQRVHKRQTRS